MLKNLSESKGKITALLFLIAVVLSKVLVAIFRKGAPSVTAIAFAVPMCIFFVVLFFMEFPSKREEFFTGQNILRIIAALVVFIGAFSELYVNTAYNTVMMMMPIIVYCSSNFKFIPIAVVASLTVLISYEPFSFTVIPVALLVILILVAPKLKEAKSWEKIVFSGAVISLAACLVYVAYQMRFIFSLSTLRAFPLKTIPLIIIAIVFAVCAAFSLKTDKVSKHKKKTKKNYYAVKKKKADYLAGITYIAVAVYAVAAAMLEGKYAMCCIVSLLSAMFVICKDGTPLQIISDKVAGVAAGFISKIEENTEE